MEAAHSFQHSSRWCKLG